MYFDAYPEVSDAAWAALLNVDTVVVTNMRAAQESHWVTIY